MEPPLLPFAKRQGENNVYKIIKKRNFLEWEYEWVGKRVIDVIWHFDSHSPFLSRLNARDNICLLLNTRLPV